MKRSLTKPILWLLFTTGGTIAAFLFPLLIAIVGILYPLGLFPELLLDYSFMLSLATPWYMRIIIGFILVTVLWHAMHRLFLTALDLHLARDTSSWKNLFYGIALSGSAAVIALLFVL